MWTPGVAADMSATRDEELVYQLVAVGVSGVQ